jgi:hypothetical protein
LHLMSIHFIFFFLWGAAMIGIGSIFFQKRSLIPFRSIVGRKDGVCLGLLLLMAPLYFMFLYTFPYSMHRDEVVNMEYDKKAYESPTIHVFGLVPGHFYNPASVFIFRGWLGEKIGGINLLHMRIITAWTGLLGVGLAFLFFRMSLPSMEAIAAALWLAMQHVYWIMSRMALRDNSVLPIAVGSLALLWHGLQKRCPFITYIGGLALGLTFHTYMPARIVVVVWFLFIFLLAVRRPGPLPFNALMELGLAAGVGFMLIAGPVMVSTVMESPASMDYGRAQLLFNPQTHGGSKSASGAATTLEVSKQNMVNGLLTFNHKIADQAWIYPDYFAHHGFLDPISGILLWVGLLLALRCKGSARKDMGLLASVGFLSVWFFLTFILDKAPNYTRLLVILPFIGYFVITAWMFLCQRTAPRFYPSCFAAGVLIILFWNAMIFRDVMNRDFEHRNEIGGMFRYIEDRLDLPRYHFYVVEEAGHPFLRYWRPPQYDVLPNIAALLPESHPLRRISVAAVWLLRPIPPYTLFMPHDLWTQIEWVYKKSYSHLDIQSVCDDEDLLAIEVQAPLGPLDKRAGKVS